MSARTLKNLVASAIAVKRGERTAEDGVRLIVSAVNRRVPLRVRSMTTTASAQHLTDFQAVVMLAEDAERGGLIEIYDRTWMKRLEGEYVVALSARLTGEGKQYLARLRRKMQ